MALRHLFTYLIALVQTFVQEFNSLANKQQIQNSKMVVQLLQEST